MFDFFNKSEQRQLTIIERLHQDKWVTQKDLLACINSSLPTLIKDIHFINENVRHVHIEECEGTYQLELTNRICLSDIFNQYIQQNATFLLLRQLFYNQNQSVEDIATAIYLSTSSTYRLIDQTNTLLSQQHFDIQITKHPCKITGDINQIRYLYVTLLKIIPHEFDDLPPLEAHILAFISDIFFELTTYYPLSYAEKYFFQTQFYINLKHIKDGLLHHQLEFNTDYIDVYHSILSHPSYYYLSQYLGQDLDLKLMAELYFPYFNTEFNFIHSHYQQTELNFLPDKKQDLFCQIKTIIETLADRFQLPVPNKGALIAKVYNMTQHYQTANGYHSLFYDQHLLTKCQYTEAHPLFCHHALHLLEQLSLTYLNELRSDFVICCFESLILNWQDLYLHLNQMTKPICVLIVSSISELFARLVKDITSLSASHQLNLAYTFQPFPTKASLSKFNYDILISNVPVVDLDTDAYILHTNLADNYFIQDLTQYIHEIRQQLIAQHLHHYQVMPQQTHTYLPKTYSPLLTKV